MAFRALKAKFSQLLRDSNLLVTIARERGLRNTARERQARRVDGFAKNSRTAEIFLRRRPAERSGIQQGVKERLARQEHRTKGDSPDALLRPFKIPLRLLRCFETFREIGTDAF